MWLGGQRIDGLSEADLARLRRRRIGLVFQFFNLLPALSVAENVELPLLLAGQRRRAARRAATGLLTELGVAERRNAAPALLSGGQQQRVALARAMANSPDVVLADEPTGNLDSVATRGVLDLLREARRRGQTLLLVTHDARVAAAADRVIRLRDGRIEVATPTGAISLTVAGTAVSPSQPRYPRSNPGLGWVSRDTLRRVRPDQDRWLWRQPVRLADPAAAPAFASSAVAALPAADVRAGLITVIPWQDQRADALLDSRPITVIVGMFTILLLTVVVAVVGILTVARVGAQYRDIGLLKAVGLTPRQVSAVFLIETAALGVAAVGVGFPIGAVLAPRLAAPSAQTLVGSPSIAVQPWHALLASCVVLPVLLLSTALAVRRATRSTSLNALRAGAPAPIPTARLGRVVARAALPLPATLSLKDLLARRRRTFWTAVAVAVTGAVVVATVQMRAALHATPGTVSDVPGELSTLVYSLDAVLVLIATTTLVAVMLLSVRERVRDIGVLKAVGLTPRQVTSGLVGAQTLLAAVAALLSIPLGIGLYLAVLGLTSGTVQGAVLASWWQVALVPVAVAGAVAVTTSMPARLAAQISVAEAIRYV